MKGGIPREIESFLLFVCCRRVSHGVYSHVFMKYRTGAVLIVLIAALVGFFVYTTEQNLESQYKFKKGLDLAGGTLLTYRADVSGIVREEISDSMRTLRDVIERRVNSADVSGALGVLEPVIQEETVNLGETNEHRIVVELPGVTDLDEATAYLQKTPILEFKLLGNGDELVANGTGTPEYIITGLTGRYLTKTQLQFSSGGGLMQEPIVALTFNKEGADLFAQITREHVGEILAIFLDGQIISAPVIQTEISDGQAVITGIGNPEEARELTSNLKFGALPVPIELIGAENIGASLGSGIAAAGVRAGFWGIIVIAGFMILWYRLPGVIATLSLMVYAVLTLALFKIIPVTLTAAGIAGFVLSVGMAIDANILVFERLKEELRSGKNINDAIAQGFSRAWLSIRDGNLTSILAALILFYMTGSLVRGFALTLILGVVVSMFSAVIITKIFMYAIAPKTMTSAMRFLFNSGFSKH